MSLKVWKTIKAVTELAAVVLMAYAITKGADPTLAIVLAGAIVLGWETVEALAAAQQLDANAGSESNQE